MKQSQFLLVALLLFSMVGLAVESRQFISQLEPDKHCVGYRVKKRMFLLRNVWVFGKNCEVSSQVLPDLGGVYYVEATIPTKQFRSGEPERDRDVFKLLGGEESPDLVFRSEKLTKEEWVTRLQQETFPIQGELMVKSKPHPVTVTAKVVDTEQGLVIDGKLNTKMTKLGIKPPKMFLGLGARVSDEVELHFHLFADKTLGADSILPRSSKN